MGSRPSRPDTAYILRTYKTYSWGGAGEAQATRLRNAHQERRRVQRVLGCDVYPYPAANVIIVYIYFPTGAGELSVPAIWPRGEQPQGYLTSPGKPLAGGPRTFTYRPACCLTK
jgi:hypothetical protein